MEFMMTLNEIQKKIIKDSNPHAFEENGKLNVEKYLCHILFDQILSPNSKYINELCSSQINGYISDYVCNVVGKQMPTFFIQPNSLSLHIPKSIVGDISETNNKFQGDSGFQTMLEHFGEREWCNVDDLYLDVVLEKIKSVGFKPDKIARESIQKSIKGYDVTYKQFVSIINGNHEVDENLEAELKNAVYYAYCWAASAERTNYFLRQIEKSFHDYLSSIGVVVSYVYDLDWRDCYIDSGLKISYHEAEKQIIDAIGTGVLDILCYSGTNEELVAQCIMHNWKPTIDKDEFQKQFDEQYFYDIIPDYIDF